uniref:Prostaglandin-H2 D-isomerase n=1 Tax=Sphenodon punctatus TaxID=8508 RepID=A0A8D0L754_SPHPU
MQTVLISLLGLALSCALPVQADVPVQADFEQEKFTGRWYSIGLASNSKWFQDKKQFMKMCTTVVTPTEDGNLDVTSTYPKMDQCEKRMSVYIRTEQPGQFSYTSQRWGSQHDIRVVETNYVEYALIHTTKTKADRTYTVVVLYGRSKDLRPELLERFTDFAKEQGLTDNEILILPKTGKKEQAVPRK